MESNWKDKVGGGGELELLDASSLLRTLRAIEQASDIFKGDNKESVRREANDLKETINQRRQQVSPVQIEETTDFVANRNQDITEALREGEFGSMGFRKTTIPVSQDEIDRMDKLARNINKYILMELRVGMENKRPNSAERTFEDAQTEYTAEQMPMSRLNVLLNMAEHTHDLDFELFRMQQQQKNKGNDIGG